jgi:hypothetical protein
MHFAQLPTTDCDICWGSRWATSGSSRSGKSQTSGFPAAERYGLCAQMRRAAVSVSANLAEGCGRMGDAELRRFVRISLGSLNPRP